MNYTLKRWRLEHTVSQGGNGGRQVEQEAGGMDGYIKAGEGGIRRYGLRHRYRSCGQAGVLVVRSRASLGLESGKKDIHKHKNKST